MPRYKLYPPFCCCRGAGWPSGAQLVLHVNRSYGYAFRSRTALDRPAACAIARDPHAISGLAQKGLFLRHSRLSGNDEKVILNSCLVDVSGRLGTR
jgi:hypothetical protein